MRSRAWIAAWDGCRDSRISTSATISFVRYAIQSRALRVHHVACVVLRSQIDSDWLACLSHLRRLNLENCLLRVLMSMAACHAIEWVGVAGNRIQVPLIAASRRCVRHAPNATSVVAHTQDVGEFSKLASPSLVSVTAAGNPCTRAKDHRTHVLRALPALLRVDGVAVTIEERERAAKLDDEAIALQVRAPKPARGIHSCTMNGGNGCMRAHRPNEPGLQSPSIRSP